MKYLLLVGHAALAQGIESAMAMLLGSRSFVVACGMEDGMTPDLFQETLAQKIDYVTEQDEVLVLGDIAGGSPLKSALAVLGDKGLGERVRAFGGANLAMAISAVMGIDDGLDLDSIRDAMLADGSQAVKEQ